MKFPYELGMRNLIDIVGQLPETVYHGTSKSAWTKPDPGLLYLTSDRADAVVYAQEACETEHYNKHEGENIEDPEIVGIVVEFRLADIVALPGVELQPDWGWVEGNDIPGDPSWEDSLRAVGSFAVSDFDAKELGTVTPAW